MEKRDHVIFYSCQKRSHAFGTGFVVSKRIKHLILDFQVKFHRHVGHELRERFLTITLYVHIPQWKIKPIKGKTPSIMN
jgi:hypothetical protein